MKAYAISLLLFFAVVFISSASALNLALSPPQVNFSLNPGEEKCANLSVSSSDYRGAVTVEDRWALQGVTARQINLHNQTADEVGITTDYQSQFSLGSQEHKFSLCLTAKNPGEFHGLLLFTAASASVGAWINVEVSGNAAPKLNENSPAPITGAVAGSVNALIGLIIVSLFVLLVLLTVLLIKIRKNRNRLV